MQWCVVVLVAVDMNELVVHKCQRFVESHSDIVIGGEREVHGDNRLFVFLKALDHAVAIGNVGPFHFVLDLEVTIEIGVALHWPCAVSNGQVVDDDEPAE